MAYNRFTKEFSAFQEDNQALLTMPYVWFPVKLGIS